MTISTKTALGLTLSALALLGPGTAALGSTPTAPSNHATDPSDASAGSEGSAASQPSELAPDDPFCAAGLVLDDAETALDDESGEPGAVRTNLRQLVRAAERLAADEPAEVDELDELVSVLADLEDHYASHDFDVDAAEADPAIDPLEEAYRAQLDVADAVTDYLEETCAELYADDETRGEAFCAAMDRLGAADEAFAEERENADPAAVEAAWDDYLHSFDEARLLGPEELRAPWDELRSLLGESEALLADLAWDYAAFQDDPAFEEVKATYEEAGVHEWSNALDEYVDDSCGPGATPAPTTD